LSQARAKACLRDFVLKEDALDVVELMSKSVDQVHSDDHGSVDRTRGGAGGTSNRKMKKAFVNELGRLIGSSRRCSLDDLVSDYRDDHVRIIYLVLVLLTRLRLGTASFHSAVLRKMLAVA
jgi:DNA replicative helicase MCM subunit Mcm2 (Cdc46/Mcm family)